MYVVKFSRDCIARPPEMTIFAAVSSGLSEVDNSSFTKAESPASAGAAIGSVGAVAFPTGAVANVEVRTVITRFASVERTTLYGVPGIDQSFKRIRRKNLRDLRDLHYVQESRDAGQAVLPDRGSRLR